MLYLMDSGVQKRKFLRKGQKLESDVTFGEFLNDY